MSSSSTTPHVDGAPISGAPNAEREVRKAGIVVLGLAIAVLLPAAYRMARPFLTAFVVAAILAVALDPVQKRVARLITRSSVAALITTAAGVVPIACVVLLAGKVIDREIKSGALSAVLRAGQRLPWGNSIDQHAIVERVAKELSEIGGAIFTSVTVLLFLYVLLIKGQGWAAQFAAILPLDSAVTNRIVSTVRDAIIATVDGTVAVAAADAVLFGIIFGFAGIPSPVIWAVLAGFASLVPVLGAMSVGLPVAVILGMNGNYLKAVIVGAGCLISQLAASELLRPRIMGNRFHMPALVVALAVLGGADAFGAVGILLGPVVVSVLGALAREFRLQLPAPPVSGKSYPRDPAPAHTAEA
jgi:predicted PurR-regulated permease PerM